MDKRVEAYSKKDFTTHQEVKDAIDALTKIGTAEDATETGKSQAGWAIHIVLRCADIGQWDGDDDRDWPNLNSELVGHALRSLAKIDAPDSITWMSAIINDEENNKKHGWLDNKPTHEDLAIELIFDAAERSDKYMDEAVGALQTMAESYTDKGLVDKVIELRLKQAARSYEKMPKAAADLARLVKRYPEQALEAMKTLDVEKLPIMIARSTMVDYTQGIRPENALGLAALVDLHEEMQAMAKHHISEESIKMAIEHNAALILNVQHLTNALRGGTFIPPGQEIISGERLEEGEATQGRFLQTPGVDKPMSGEKVSELRALFERIDASGVSPKKFAPVFNAIVDSNTQIGMIQIEAETLRTGIEFEYE